jgi:diapolycopene oxygenase
MRDTLDVGGAFNLEVLKDVMRMRLGKTVAGVIREYIPDPNTAQMLDHFVQYVGSSPDASPAILCAIGHMQMKEGIWYPESGTRAVPEALVKLATELGVVFHTETDVAKILTDAQGSGVSGVTRVKGLVTTRGIEHTFDAVVSNEDAVRTQRELVGGEAAKIFKHKRSYEPACSGVVLYLGLNRRYEHLAHHDFVFSRDAHEEFQHIYKLGEPAPDPTCYLAATAATDPASAPPGGEQIGREPPCATASLMARAAKASSETRSVISQAGGKMTRANAAPMLIVRSISLPSPSSFECRQLVL